MHRFLLALLLTSACTAEPIANLAAVDDGLNPATAGNISDDYIRLNLFQPSYQTANSINSAITEWLGPNMVIVKDRGLILVQAPRDSSARVEFVSALLELDIQ